jgi:hypothetical protein
MQSVGLANTRISTDYAQKSPRSLLLYFHGCCDVKSAGEVNNCTGTVHHKFASLNMFEAIELGCTGIESLESRGTRKVDKLVLSHIHTVSYFL